MSCTTLPLEEKTGSCALQAWFVFDWINFFLRTMESKGFPKGYMAQSIDCSFTDCSMKILPRGGVRALCMKRKCSCGESDKCKKIQKFHNSKVMMKM
jgi:hypothetical protein